MSNKVIEPPQQETQKPKDNCLTLKFKNNEVRILGKITSFWLVANDVYAILVREDPNTKVSIDELIEAGVDADNLSTSEIGIVVNFIGLICLVRCGKKVNESRAIEFKEWVFKQMFPKIWSWTNDRCEASH
ncbi:hypothetical protein [Allocoleopsis sp.]|uniref:hypothetical protein n=1 Tax=Allocoleopsis sp. TaxID=3088169 RepID=UPI002FD2B848